VRRAGVTTTWDEFEPKGLIRHGGNVTILDREGLIEAANGLYGLPQADAERLSSGARRD
jgi:hypothetical protein